MQGFSEYFYEFDISIQWEQSTSQATVPNTLNCSPSKCDIIQIQVCSIKRFELKAKLNTCQVQLKLWTPSSKEYEANINVINQLELG